MIRVRLTQHLQLNMCCKLEQLHTAIASAIQLVCTEAHCWCIVLHECTEPLLDTRGKPCDGSVRLCQGVWVVSEEA